MTFSQTLKNHIAPLHLLQHPFYQAWSEGRLSKTTLRDYATQYYKHVQAFPRYISAAHAQCEDLENRRILLENLADEEGLRGENHPKLWMDFAQGLGLNKNSVEAAETATPVEYIIQTFLSSSHKSYEQGLASLYAYEYQIPEVAQSKIEGLKTHFQVTDQKSLSFFETHKTADIYHRKACETLLDKIPEAKQKGALEAAKKSAQALWDFLSTFSVEPSVA